MKLKMAIKFAKHFEAKLETCCGDPLYVDVAEPAVRKLLKPYLNNDEDKTSTFHTGHRTWAMTTATKMPAISIFGNKVSDEEIFEHRCECDDASIATLNTSTRTMTVGW